MLKKDFTFSDGTKVKVHEVSNADLDVFMELSNVSFADVVFNTFARLYYPVLAACTNNAPSLDESYLCNPEELDSWFALCCELNPDWLGIQSYKEETIKLNGKKVTIKSRRPSVEMRLAQFQEEAKTQKPLEHPKDEEYRLNGYIGVAAASFGGVPTAYEARHDLSQKEFALWHETVRRLIPEWYESAMPVTEQAETKKKEKDAQSSL